MGVRIFICHSDVVVTVDGTSSGDCTSLRTNERITLQIGVGWDELGAGEFSTVELVGNQNLKGVVDRV